MNRGCGSSKRNERCRMKLALVLSVVGLWTSSAVALPRLAKAGEMCGGIAGIRCAPGLSCKVTARHPDAGGKCVKAPKRPVVKGGGPGAFCGGIAGIRCKPGLRCKLSGNFPDAGGRCAR